jgi:tetraacyldisaccharide 4'-kinase
MENFQAIADEFRAAGADVEIDGAGSLAGAVDRLLRDEDAAREIGRRALACANASRGASARAAAEVLALYRSHVPCYRPALPWYPLLSALSRLWRWGGALKREADLRAQKKLDMPVISVGNLTMGGTGKTPCVLRLAELLRDRGRRPGILTRGYKRATPHAHLVLAPGAAVGAAQSGDEPQIFVRSGLAPVGIGAERWETGMLLCRQFDVDVMLLDDGFQHLKLARDLDIVLVDALNPFGGGGVFPLGRLRESIESLARADVVLITRGRYSDLACAIERTVRQWNPQAPVFRAFVEPREWVEHRTGNRFAVAGPPFESAGVFCGLGNPQAFRLTLRELGIDPVAWVDFEDHHRYRPHELRRVAHLLQAAGARAAVTTEKDAVNLCEECDDLLRPLPLFWLRVSMQIEREDEFLKEIGRRIG